jgi:hypothetical protein
LILRQSPDPSEVPVPGFQQQVDRLVSLGYPRLARTDEPTFRERLEPLRPVADPITVSFALVVTRDLVSPYDAVPLLRLDGGSRPGRVDRNHAEGDLATYHPVEDAQPPGSAYLLVDPDRGEEFCGVPPEEATATIRARGRSPLTIDEGIAWVLQQPEVLEKNKCFMLAGSRRSDRRVPALWISERAPKLGWCWDGNPHTWLGTASAAARLG